MNPVIPCSVGSVPLIHGHGTSILTRKNNSLTTLGLSSSFVKHGASTLRFLLTPFVPNRLLPPNKRKHPFHKICRSSTSVRETEVALEKPDSPLTDEDSAEASETLSDASPASAKASRSRSARRSEMPPVKNEDLVPGATFTGKVKSIQPYGAFIDFGAFTDGLVHVSRLSDGYVKDVANVVSVGQEVKVKLIEVNTETQRISLSMREGDDDTGKLKQVKDTPISAEKAGPGRMNTSKPSSRKDVVKKSTKFVIGQDLEGTVKNMTRTGSFISLPDGEEGFLPISEESEEGFGNVTGVSSLQVGQEVSVRVLRIARGQVTLTMKKEEDIAKVDSQLGQGIVHTATNPFALAFRQNRDIAEFLDEREKIQDSVEAPSTTRVSEELNGVFKQGETLSDVSGVQGELESSESLIQVSSEVKYNVEDDFSEIDVNMAVGENAVDHDEKDPVSNISSPVLDEDGTSEKEVKTTSGSLAPEGNVRTVDEIVENVTQTNVTTSNVKSESPLAVTNNSEEEFSAATSNDSEEVEPNPNRISSITASDVTSSAPASQETAAAIPPALVKQLREETGAGMMDCKKALSETDGDIIKALDFLRKKGLASAEKKASRVTAEGRIGSYIHDSRIGILVEVNCETDFVSRGEIFKELVDDIAMQVAACPHVQYLVPEEVPEEVVNKEKEIEMQKEDLLSKPEQMRSKIVEGRIRKRLEELALLEQPYIKNDKVAIKDWVKQTISTVGENIKVKRFVRFNLGEGLEKKSQDFAAEVAAQTEAKPAPTPEKEQAVVAEDKETQQKPPAVTVSAALVKQLREETGAGMMDCKKALAETGGDLEKAQFYLRKKGLSTADKKSSRLAAEGRIGSYIHDSRIGVLIEVNCETDFVGRSEKFKHLVDDLAMQVVASPQVRFVSIEDIPESIVNKEKEIEMQREDIVSKPENIRERIVEGRVSKRLGELALLEQPFIKDDSVLVKDLVKQTVAAVGENIKVRRFVRFTLGETAESETTEAP